MVITVGHLINTKILLLRDDGTLAIDTLTKKVKFSSPRLNYEDLLSLPLPINKSFPRKIILVTELRYKGTFDELQTNM